MLYGDKRFLNEDPRETGAIAFCVETPTKIRSKHDAVDASIHIQDCSSKVWLDLSFKTHTGLAKRLKKIDLMIDVLTKGKEQLTLGYQEFEPLKAAFIADKENK